MYITSLISFLNFESIIFHLSDLYDKFIFLDSQDYVILVKIAFIFLLINIEESISDKNFTF